MGRVETARVNDVERKQNGESGRKERRGERRVDGGKREGRREGEQKKQMMGPHLGKGRHLRN